MTDFETAFARAIGHEGGYVNDPTDPGGETKFGISKRSYPHLHIAGLTLEKARDIYRQDFWNRLHMAQMPDGVAFQLFDFAINSGIETAVRHLQRAVGVADDGNWGPVSQVALGALSESDLIQRLLAERLDFMTRLRNWPSAGKGWARRIAANLRFGAEDS